MAPPPVDEGPGSSRDLPAPADPVGRELAGADTPEAALRTGARRTLVPALLGGLVLAPVAIGWLLPGLLAILRPAVPGVAFAPLAATLYALFPLLVALPAALAARDTTRRLAGRDTRLARAAGAGAGLAVAGIGLTWLAGLGLMARAWTTLLGFVPPVLLAVGSVGYAAFRDIPSRRGDPAGNVPRLYQGLGAFALTGFLGFCALSAVTWLVGSFVTFPGGEARVAVNLALSAALVPLAYLTARTLRRRAPGVPRLSVVAGLLAPPVAVIAFLLHRLWLVPWLTLADLYHPLLGMLGYLLGAGLNAGVVTLAMGREPAALPPAEERPALPGGDGESPGPEAGGG